VITYFGPNSTEKHLNSTENHLNSLENDLELGLQAFLDASFAMV